LALVGWQEVVGVAIGDFELGALGMTLCFCALCASAFPGVNVDAAAVQHPAATIAASVREVTFGETITGELPSLGPVTPPSGEEGTVSRSQMDVCHARRESARKALIAACATGKLRRWLMTSCRSIGAAQWRQPHDRKGASADDVRSGVSWQAA